MKSDGSTSRDFKQTKTRDQVMDVILDFTEGSNFVLDKYHRRLQDIYSCLQKSQFFQNHELIGSSLLFVHDKNDASIWMIDFAKSVAVPQGLTVTHEKPWKVGNHEDGYLIGIANLIQIFKTLIDKTV